MKMVWRHLIAPHVYQDTRETCVRSVSEPFLLDISFLFVKLFSIAYFGSNCGKYDYTARSLSVIMIIIKN